MAQRACQLADSFRHSLRRSLDGSRGPARGRSRDAQHGCRPCLTRELDIETANENKQTALAFDYGEQRVGVAFANRITGTATALPTLENRNPEELGRLLRKLFSEWRPDTIVIGVPYNMDGSESPMTGAAIRFANRLAEEYALPVDEVDERLTSAAAGEILREQRRSGQRRRRVRQGDVDSMAAQLIADSWLRRQ